MKYITRALSASEVKQRRLMQDLLHRMRACYHQIRCRLQDPLVDAEELYNTLAHAGLIRPGYDANLVRETLSSPSLKIPVSKINGETKFFFPFVLEESQYDQMHLVDLMTGVMLMDD